MGEEETERAAEREGVRSSWSIVTTWYRTRGRRKHGNRDGALRQKGKGKHSCARFNKDIDCSAGQVALPRMGWAR